MDNLEQIIHGMKKQLDMIVESIVGNPSDTTKPGLLIRIDRLERSNKNLRNIVWFIGSTTILMLSNLVVKYL